MRQRHATHAATELHLLREAEEILGRLAWAEVEGIEELSVEYWNLRKFTKNYEELSQKIESANVNLSDYNEHRTDLLGMVVDSSKDLTDERATLAETSERLKSERETIVEDARAVKRRHDGVTAKLEVLVGESDQQSPKLDASRQDLLRLKTQFKELRDRRDALVVRIDSIESALKDIDARIETRRSEMRDEALGNYQNIGKANQDLSSNRAKRGSLESEMISLFSQIGRYILSHHHDPSVAKVASEHRSLINQMAALTLSITLNNRLAGRTNAKTAQSNKS
jgi:chromosome segregation ATPase